MEESRYEETTQLMDKKAPERSPRDLKRPHEKGGPIRSSHGCSCDHFSWEGIKQLLDVTNFEWQSIQGESNILGGYGTC